MLVLYPLIFLYAIALRKTSRCWYWRGRYFFFLLYNGVGYISATNMSIIYHMPWFSFSQLFFIEELILFHQQESSEAIEVAPEVQNTESSIICKLPALAVFASSLSCLFNINVGDWAVAFLCEWAVKVVLFMCASVLPISCVGREKCTFAMENQNHCNLWLSYFLR